MTYNHSAVGRSDDGRLSRISCMGRPVPMRQIGPCTYILLPSVLRGGKLQKVLPKDADHLYNYLLCLGGEGGACTGSYTQHWTAQIA